MEIRAQEIGFSYRRGRPVLRGVDVALEPGLVTGVVGPNGAGKSTLLRLLSGVVEAQSGSVLWDGAPIATIAVRERARRLAFVPQRPSLAFGFSVGHYVGLGRYCWGGGGAGCSEALTAVDLSPLSEEPFGSLSAGQQQRAAIARALAQLGLPGGDGRGKALILDEPVSAQDPRHALGVFELLRGMAGRGLLVALTLHDLATAARVCDRIIVVGAGGRIAASGTVREALSPAVLSEVFAVRFDPALVPTGAL